MIEFTDYAVFEFLNQGNQWYKINSVRKGISLMQYIKETEQIRISSNLRDNEVYIRKQCENCADILVRPMRLGEDRKVDCLMVYIEVTVSNMMLDDSAIGKMINHFWKIPPEKIQEFLKNNSLGIADVQKLENMDEVFGESLWKNQK